ncbi:MLO-like protein [Striga asiatica]|uniref:MLO-like protein n=1 Tax=Striga asiatica TaxID=4170 RepID=A0A5A7PPZ2_STRAF|nr:MLO-like protein [Striga asiatica]
MAASTNRSLQETPTWALATVCFVFIFLGIFIEHLIHLSGHLGFMSLILTVTQKPISKICVPNNLANRMLPCHRQVGLGSKAVNGVKHLWVSFGEQNQMPRANFKDFINFPDHRVRRELAAAASYSPDYCGSKGKTSLISEQGINQLNILIFVLAAMQIVYSVATMGLGRAKMRRWKIWEKETQTIEYMAQNDPERFRLTRQTTFWQRHVGSCATNPAQLWIKCFFRQFFNSVAKIDYFTLRHGFISTHLSTNTSFNFLKYIRRSLEDDFKAIVGISPTMWFTVVVFLLVDVHGWNMYLWVSLLPLTIVLFVGTKLEVIVARMAVQLTDRNTVIKGSPLVQPDDSLFWFSRPQLVLTLLHFTLFMNSFELAFFAWVTWQFGIKSCYHENWGIIIVRIVLAVMVQVICGYITLPLYALVTQMGSQYKNAILEEHTFHAIKQWHANVKEKRKKPNSSIQDTNNPDSSLSPHRQTPTLSEFSSRGGPTTPHEITEISEVELTHDNNNNIQMHDDGRL